jgi:outer membrane protein insertion porin family
MRWALAVGALVLLPTLSVAEENPAEPATEPPSAAAPSTPPAGADAAPNPGQPNPAAALPPATPPSVAPELAGQVAREIQLRGNTRISSDRLLGLMATKPGRPIDPVHLEKDLSALEQEYHRHGYRLMRALSPEPLTEDGVLTIPLQEGVVESIQVVGNKKTRRSVILRQMETKAGSVYNEHTVRDDRQRLSNLNIFRDVQVGSAAGTELGQAIVSVRVMEARTAELYTTVGYNSEDGLLGYFYGQEENLFGTGQQVSARWERLALTGGSAYQATYFTPFTLLPKTSLRVTGFQTSPYRFVYATGDIDRDNVRSYEVRTGGALQLGRELNVRNQLQVGFRSESVDYRDLPIGVRIPQGYSIDYGRVQVVSLGLTNDTRDLRFDPRHGGVHALNVEFGGVGDGGGNFTRYTANLRRYYPAGRSRVWANRLFAGTSSGEVPLSELFWLGGPDSVRGYERDSFFGRSAVALSSELRFPVGTGLQLVGFVDAGHASGSGGVKASVGAGLRVVTPIGPLRLDFAVGSDGARSHFTAGYVAF